MTVQGRETTDGTVGRTLAVLDLVAAFGRPVRFAEILPVAGLPKATLYRFLQALTHQDMLAYDEDRQTYAPGMRLVRLAHSAWAQSSLAPLAQLCYCQFMEFVIRRTAHVLCNRIYITLR